MTHSKSKIQNPKLSLPRYPRYKDSGFEWLGEIPEHWEVSKTRWLWKEVEDPSENGDEQLLSISQYTGVTPTSAESRSESLVGYRRCKPDDLAMNIMLAWQGGLGVSNYAGIVSPAYSVFRLRSDNNAHYLGYLYRTKRYLDEFGRHSTGIVPSRWRLYPDKFGHVLTLLPPKPEQDRIVAFLDQKTAEIDALIAKKQRQIELLDEQKAILINRAVTRGLNPNAKLKPSGIEWIGDIPVHWEVKPGLTYFKETDVRSITGDEELLSVSHLTGVTPRSEKNITMFMAESYEGSKLCEIGDIAVNTMWAWMAALGVSKYRGLVSPSYNTYRQKLPNPYQPEFLDLLLRSNPYTGHYFINSTGITTSRLRLYPHPFLRLKFIRPPDSEQKKIVDYCSKASGLIATSKASVTKQIESLRALRSTLIAHAVTGRIKV